MKSVRSEEDDPVSKKESLDQVQQLNKNFVAEDSNSDALLMADNNVTVMGDVMIKKEIRENETEKEEEDEEDGDNKIEIVE